MFMVKKINLHLDISIVKHYVGYSLLIENGYNKYTDWLIVNPKSQLEELGLGSSGYAAL